MNRYDQYPIYTFVIFASLAGLLILTPAGASGAGASGGQWVGKIQGYSFVNGSKYYPVDAADPLASAERMFVFVEGAGDNGFFLLDTLDHDILSAFVGKQVRLKGAVKQVKDRKVIAVDGIESRQGDRWRSEWTRWEWESNFYDVDH